MASRLFRTEQDADLIITEKTKNKSATVAEICNTGIYRGYLPYYARMLNTEAHFILQKEDISQWEIKQSISRGVEWLQDYHIKKPDILKHILSHFDKEIFPLPEYEVKEDTRPHSVIAIMRDAYSRLKDLCPDGYLYETSDPIVLANQILEYWNHVYNEKIMYKMIATAIYVNKNSREFSRGEAVDILKEIENEVLSEHISQEKLNADKEKELKYIDKLCWLFDKAQHGIQIEKVYSMGGVINVEMSDSAQNFKIGRYYGFYDLLDKLCENLKCRDSKSMDNGEDA